MRSKSDRYSGAIATLVFLSRMDDDHAPTTLAHHLALSLLSEVHRKVGGSWCYEVSRTHSN